MMMMIIIIIIDAESKLFAGAPYKTKVQTWLTVHQMLDSAGKWVAEQGQLQFLAERRERLDIPDGCLERIPRARRSHRKRAVAEGGLTCQHDDASSSAAPLFGPSYSSSSPLSANSAPCFHYCRMQLHCNTLTNCLNVPHSSPLFHCNSAILGSTVCVPGGQSLDPEGCGSCDYSQPDNSVTVAAAAAAQRALFRQADTARSVGRL